MSGPGETNLIPEKAEKTPIIPALRRLKQEDYKFEPNLGNLAKPCPKIKIYKKGLEGLGI